MSTEKPWRRNKLNLAISRKEDGGTAWKQGPYRHVCSGAQFRASVEMRCENARSTKQMRPFFVGKHRTLPHLAPRLSASLLKVDDDPSYSSQWVHVSGWLVDTVPIGRQVGR